MSFTVHNNRELLRDVASGLPDSEYDPYVHEQNAVYCVFDAVEKRWVDVPPPEETQ